MAITIIIIILVIIGIANAFLFYHFPPYPKLKAHQRYDCALVLGCPTRENGEVSRMQKERMNHAIALYRKGIVKMIVISGGGVRNRFVEATVMKAYAISQGVDADAILEESKARNTYDNLKYSKQTCDDYHFKSIVVVSSSFHLRRSAYFVKKFFNNYAMSAPNDHEHIKHYIAEYFRMWNTLYYEYIVLKNLIRKSNCL